MSEQRDVFSTNENNPLLLYATYITVSIIFFVFTMTTVKFLHWGSILQEPMLAFAIFLIGMMLLYRSQTLGTLILQMIIILISGFYYLNVQESYIVFLPLIILALPYLPDNITTLLKIDAIVKIIIVGIIAYLSLTGAIQNFVNARSNGAGIRTALGFMHANQVGAIIFSFLAELIYISKHRKRAIAWSILFLLVFFRLYDSRTSLVGFFIFIIFFQFFQLKAVQRSIKSSKWIRFLLRNTFTIMTLSSFIAVFLFNIGNQSIKELNMVLSQRIALSSAYLKLNRISLFSKNEQNLHGHNSLFAGIDNQYFHLLLIYGVIALIIFLWFMHVQMKEAIAMEDFKLLSAMLAFAFYGLMESVLIIPFINFTWLIIGMRLRYKKIRHEY